MNVVFFSHDADVYGASRSLINLIQGLQRRNVNCYVIIPQRGRLEKLLTDAQIPYAIIHNTRWVTKSIPPSHQPLSYLKWRWSTFRKAIASLKRLPLFTKQARKWNADVIYTNSSVAWIGLVVSWFTGIPHVWHIREFKDLDQGVQLEWGKRWFDRGLKHSKANIFISKALRSHIYHLRKTNHAFVVPNGVAWEADFDIRRNRNIRHEPFHFLIIGTVHESKGQHEAIRAFAEVRKQKPLTKLLVVGRGRIDEAKVVAQAFYVSDHVEFWGHIDDPTIAYQKADALLVCSRNEAFGRVTAEGMSHALPVIGFDNAGTSEIITHLKTGLLYREGELDLADQMLKLMDDPELRQRLAHAGWNHAKQEFTIEKYSDRIFEILTSVTKNSNAS